MWNAQDFMPYIDFDIDSNTERKIIETLKNYPANMKDVIMRTLAESQKETKKAMRLHFQQSVYISKMVIAKAIKTKSPSWTGESAVAEIRVCTRRQKLVKAAEIISWGSVNMRGIPIRNRQRVRYRLMKGGRIFGDISHSDASDASRLFPATMKAGHKGIWWAKKSTGKIGGEEFAPSLQFYMRIPGFESKMDTIAADSFSKHFLAAAKATLPGVLM